MYFRKKYIEKIDLQESYNNFKIKLKISFVNRAPVERGGSQTTVYQGEIGCGEKHKGEQVH